MNTAVRKMGNSSGVILPKTLLTQLSLVEGDRVVLHAENGRIIIEPVRKATRAGWAEEAQRLAKSGEDNPVWPEFGSAEDKNLTW